VCVCEREREVLWMKSLSFRVFAVIFNTVVSNVSLLQRMRKVVSLKKFGIFYSDE
jgi:hypothetical protein